MIYNTKVNQTKAALQSALEKEREFFRGKRTMVGEKTRKELREVPGKKAMSIKSKMRF